MPAATFTVTITNDSGAGSLRQAILEANALAGADLIVLNLPASSLTISPTSALPPITEAVTIDGTTQPGFSSAPIVELSGASAGANTDGLRLWAGNSLIRGFVINRFNGDGIEIATNGNNAVEGCFIGLSVSGTTDLGNNASGIFITNSPNNRIGGTNAAQRNVISGNQQNGVLVQGLGAAGNRVLGNFIGLNAAGGGTIANSANGIFLNGARANTIGSSGAGNVISGNTQSGVRLEGTNAHANGIAGNIIGLDPAGAADLGNGQQGIWLVNAPTNTIGGTDAAERNVISGNGQAGVRLDSASTRGNVVLGNLIGPDRTGTQDLGNDGDGVYVINAPGNAIGAAAIGAGNLISGNNNDGIELNGASTTNNIVAGNRIGVDAAGAALANGQNGIVFNSSARFNTAGLDAEGGGNLIAFNGNNGVAINSGTNNGVRASRIFGNGALGLDLGNNGVTANDPDDTDTGVNQLQNFPVLTAGTIHPASVEVAGTLNSRANSSYTLDFFANLVCDGSGHGEGQQFVGSTAVSTDGSGNAGFSVSFAAVPAGRYLSATATDTNGNTSEFSACFAAASTLSPVTLVVVNTNDSGPGSLRQALLDADLFPSAGPNVIAFNIPGAGPHMISPLTQLPTNREPVFIDGYTQPGASANTLADGNNAVILVRLDGAGTFGATGLRLRASGCVVRGLSITGFGRNGLDINGATNCVVAGNLIGLAPDGTARRNAENGVQVFDTPGNRIGGTAPADRNILSGNFNAGVHLIGVGASNNVVEGNFIGTSPDGAAARANFLNGVFVQEAPRNRIGGATPGARNVISGNPAGIEVSGFESVHNVIIGNFIGPDAAGVARLGSQAGVHLESCRTNRVGGSAPGEANVISGNQGVGIRIGTDAVGNLVLGNRIGVGLTGGAFSNGAAGIFIRGNANRIGSALAGEGNEIAFNAPGIEVELGTGNAIRGNSIHDNKPRFAVFGGLGIDLTPFGVTTNDVGDADGGVNLLQNFPVLTAATASGASTRVQGTLNSRPSATFALDFFSNPDCDPSGHGEGLKYLGATSVTTDGSGLASFDVTLAVAAEGRQITATATDASGNTSEFSPCFAASVDLPPQTFFVTNTNDSGPGSLRHALLDAQSSPASANNIVAFNIGAGGVRPSPGAETMDGPLAAQSSEALAPSVVAAPEDGRTPFQAAGDAGQTFTIRLTNPLASLFEGVTIDGFTQPGASASTLPEGNNAVWRIRLDGSLLGAGANGLTLEADGCVVRGLEVTGFRGYGIRVAAGGDFSSVEGCRLMDNQSGGVSVDNSSSVAIGGTMPEDRNVIHRNGVGIQMSGATATGNVVAGNWIGTDPAGTTSGNFSGGVVMDQSASGNLVGGASPGAGNRIAFNNFAGVAIFSGAGNDILGNSIVSNVGLGIELFPGANGNLAPPNVTAATILANGVQCSGTFVGQPSTTYTLHTYSSRTPNAEGEFYLGEATASTDGAGNANFTITTGGTFIGRHLTLTVTGPNEGTSEFSAAFRPGSVRPPRTFIVTTAADDGPGSLRQALIDANNFLAAGNNLIHFNIPGAGPHRINLLSFLPVPTEPLSIDGYTQPGAMPNTSSNRDNAVLKIQLDGSLLPGGSALVITNSGNTIRGLSFTRFSGDAISISGPSNLVAGNWIGVDPSGAAANNSSAGITIISRLNLIGGTNPAARNIISANEDGILIAGASASNNVVTGNFIGVAPDGTNALGNAEDGVRLLGGASWNTIGDLNNSAAGNTIAYNGEDGVSVGAGRQNGILRNRIWGNGQKNIFVAPGANDGVQPPRVTQAYTGSLVVEGEFNGFTNTLYRVEVFIKEYGERGGVEDSFFVGSFEVRTDISGKGMYRKVIEGDFDDLDDDERVVTTVTCENNTSEESNAAQIVPGDSADLDIAMQAPSEAVIGSTNTYVITVENEGPATATDVCFQQGFPPSLQVLSATSTNGSCTISNGIVKCVVGTLAEDEEARILVTTVARAAGNMVTSARVTSRQRDAFPGNNTVTRETFVRGKGPPVDVQVSTSVSPTNATPGTPAEVTSVVHNVLNAASNVVFRLSAPPGTVVTSFNSTKGRCDVIDGVVDCYLDFLAMGEEVTIRVGARVETYGPVSVFEFGSAVTTSGSDFNPFNNVSGAAMALQMPSLKAEREGAQATISWPGPAPGVQLETVETLGDVLGVALEWVRVPPGSISFENGNHVHRPTKPVGKGQAFYQLAPTDPPTPSVQLYQMSLNFDLAQVPLSDWGRADVTFTPRLGVVQYLNLSLPCPEDFPPPPGFRAAGGPEETNECWVIQNVPLISNTPNNRPAKVSISFPLSSNSVSVSSSSWGFSVTTNTITFPPSLTNGVRFAPSLSVTWTGVRGRPTTWWPATPLIGGGATNIWTAKTRFANLEQGLNEDVPASILNSLTYLKTYLTVTNLPWAFLTLTNMMTATGWEPGGAPEGFLGFGTWVDYKKDFMVASGIQIQTIETNSIHGAIWGLTNCYDVEIWYEGHTACVVAIADIGNGDYAITIQHDTLQGAIGGTGQEIVIFDSESGTVYGSTWGRDFEEFVIERPGTPR
jgi:uncharacterized repeat protein (TIGR01451 family)